MDTRLENSGAARQRDVTPRLFQSAHPGQNRRHAHAMVQGLTVVSLLIAIVAAAPATATPPGPSIVGGGSTFDMSRFALAISGGTGHFECLMPEQMTVQATVTGVDSINSGSASFHGTADVILAGGNPFGLPPGPIARGTPFQATVDAGGPGVGHLDLVILGLEFPGAVEHGQVRISP